MLAVDCLHSPRCPTPSAEEATNTRANKEHKPTRRQWLTPPEWIKLISAQSNTVCEESSKKTISPEHVIEALKVGSALEARR